MENNNSKIKLKKDMNFKILTQVCTCDGELEVKISDVQQNAAVQRLAVLAQLLVSQEYSSIELNS
jgi:hypothetical protein